MTEPLLDVRDLSVRFDTGRETVTAVDRLSLSVERGEIVGLVGESGCGKSATVRAIAGVTDDAAVIDGDVSFDGTDLLEVAQRRRRRIRATRLSTVFQDPAATLTPTRTVGSHLEEVLRVAERPDDGSLRTALGLTPRDWGVTSNSREARAETLLENVGLDGRYRERYPHELSGGEAQRVSLSLALASAPDLLLADEPTTALDATTKVAVLDLLERLVDERELGLLLVSHDLGLVGDVCDRVVVAYAGQVMEAGPADRVLESPRHPYTRALLDCRLENAAPGTQLPAIEGTVPDPTAELDGCPFAPRCPHATGGCRTGALERVALEAGGRVRCRELDRIDANGSASGAADSRPGITVDGGTPIGRPQSGEGNGATTPPTTTESGSTGTPEPDADRTPLLEVENVTCQYTENRSWLGRLLGRDESTTAVADVSLTVRRGETLGIVGESGAGKSTLIDLFTGTTAPTAGEIRLEGDPVGTIDERSRPQLAAVGRLFQHPRSSLDPRQRVRAAIAEPLREAGWDRSRRIERIHELLALVGLDERHAQRRPRELSGGQCQRVALARAIALEPELVVLDEPTAALDLSVRAQVCNLLLELQSRLDCAFVVVSHDLGVVRHLSDRIAVMRDGHIVESGPAAQLCTAPETTYTRRLLEAASGIDDPATEHAHRTHS